MADAALTTGKCLVQKHIAWDNLRSGQRKAQVKQLKGKPADFATCQTKFQEKLANITDQATKATIPCRYGNNGDRTVTDYDTGLQWEQKSGRIINGFDGFICLIGDAHCVNKKYTWDEASLFVDGSTDGTTSTSCFFGHCDWRLPTIVELQTILLEPCATNPCIDPIFGPTFAAYWSATTFTVDVFPNTGPDMWNVHFDIGVLDRTTRGNKLAVRAVRAGL